MLGAAGQPSRPVTIPAAFTTFPGEIWRTPRSWVEKAYPNVIYFNEVGKGGHFAAWEEPGLFSEELRAAFRPLRSPALASQASPAQPVPGRATGRRGNGSTEHTCRSAPRPPHPNLSLDRRRIRRYALNI